MSEVRFDYEQTITRLRGDVAKRDRAMAGLSEQLRLTNIDCCNAEAQHAALLSAAQAVVERWESGHLLPYSGDSDPSVQVMLSLAAQVRELTEEKR